MCDMWSEDYYQLEYSASFSGRVHGEATVEDIKGYEYYVSFERAFESLISEKYRSLIFTISLISVAFVHSPDDVFDSQARDIFGKSYSQGTCLLLDIS